MDDYIVLVDEKNNPIGKVEKLISHNQNTQLHRGFSVFLFNQKGELLLQQRSSQKKTWPLVWSNSCCGHPNLDESNINAAKRRLQFELNINQALIYEIISDYRYSFEKDEIVENEICPILVAFCNQQPVLNKDEVENIKWISWEKWLSEVKVNFKKYSPWCIEETLLLEQNSKFHQLFLEAIKKLPSK